ncbi:MAG: hypothetical protein WKF66_12765 [Pedobacter sp.]
MKRISALILVTVTVMAFQSCTKSDDNKKRCWKCTTTKNDAKEVKRVCDKTLSEISAYTMENLTLGQLPSRTKCVPD